MSGSAVQESDLNQIVEAVGTDGVAWKLVGWVFYNAHGVTTTTVDIDVPLVGGTEVSNAIAQSGGLSPVLYVIPPVLLVSAGLFAARTVAANDLGDALKIGPAVAASYLPLSVVGALLFTVRVDTSTGGPTLVPTVGLAGLVYPLLFGTAGTVVGVVLTARAHE